MAVKLNLDKLDYQIIQEMMENAETSYADLGKKLFVSGGTIHVRIKKLEEAGVVPIMQSRAAFAAQIQRETAMWGKALKDSGIKAE